MDGSRRINRNFLHGKGWLGVRQREKGASGKEKDRKRPVSPRTLRLEELGMGSEWGEVLEGCIEMEKSLL